MTPLRRVFCVLGRTALSVGSVVAPDVGGVDESGMTWRIIRSDTLVIAPIWRGPGRREPSVIGDHGVCRHGGTTLHR